MSLQNIFYTRNSVLELGHVTNVTIFLKETAASGWGSRSHFGNGERDRGRERARETAKDNIFTRKEVVEFLWDTQNTQTLPY